MSMDELKNCYVYRGEWKNDKKHGRGLIEWQDDVNFQGNWENGMMKDGFLLFRG